MRTVTSILIVLLLGILGGGAYLYRYQYQPLAADYAALQSAQPGLEKALKRFQDIEQKERDWTSPLAGMLQSGLADEVEAGTAEVLVAGGQVIIHIAEDVLYTPRSVTFAKDSRPFQLRLAGLLNAVKDKDILIGNATQPAPAQGRGRKRVPAKDARTLASARSHELVKALVRNGVGDDRLVEAAYGEKMPDRGVRVKGSKTIIVISAPEPAGPAAAPPVRPVTAPSGTAVPPNQPRQQNPIPISPAQ